MNQHLLVKMRQLGTPHRRVACRDAGEGREQDAISFANLGNSLAKAGPMSGASAQRGPRSALAIGPYLRLAP